MSTDSDFLPRERVRINSKEDYLCFYPEETRYILAVAVNPQTGEINTEWFQGNYDKGLMGIFVVAHTYINTWNVSFTEISQLPF